MFASVLRDHMPEAGPLLVGLAIALVALGRYLIFAGGALGIITLFRRPLRFRQIQKIPFTSTQMTREFLYSLSSFIVFASVGLAGFRLNETVGFFAIYKVPDQYGWVWFALSVPVALLVHDFYFYWAHRFMHQPGIFERVHRIHHLSTNPSPLAAFAFHPLEAVIEALGFILILTVVPMHPLAFLIVSTLMITINVIGHLGYELYPSGLQASAFGKFLNTATGHNQHHRAFSFNYGLYPLVWDRLFKTTHPHYEATFDALTARQSAGPDSPLSDKGNLS